MDVTALPIPDDVEALKAALKIALAKAGEAQDKATSAEQKHFDVAAELAVAKAMASEDKALITHQALKIAKLERQVYGSRKERGAQLQDQMELELEEREASATEDEIAAEIAVAKTTTVAGFVRKRPQPRTTFPDHLPRERVVLAPPTACDCCGSGRLRKLGEDVTRTLESIPRQWKVIETVREKFTCRDCEKISQAPAPFHVIPRGWAGPSLLAMILYEKFGAHQPLNRLCERYALEGVPIALSTMADAVGAGCFALSPILSALERHVFSAERLHGDDTTVPVLAAGKTDIARCWGYVADDKPFGGTDPPAAMFYYSRDRSGVHPQAHLAQWSGVFQADAFSGYDKLYAPDRTPGQILQAACWAHARRPFFIFADLQEAARRKAAGKKPVVVSPVALEVVRRIDALFDIERDINGQPPETRHAVRQELSKPIALALHAYLEEKQFSFSRTHDLYKAIRYLLKRWPAFTLFLDDGRVCLSNNAAERALRGIALGRKSWLFCGSDRGGQRAAAMYSLIVTAKMNDVDPHAWLADVLARIATHPAHRIEELLPWNWKALRQEALTAAAA
ncbi:IS66 family transposase [Phenylobacterium sp.]|uniref:IS66 family transposase n=1 Tax=Phenylobacterium sp. TaxID=1871053 RepID=UPI0027303EC9|nr:IS66 family transposase [Phenylobacterium sp.]MDP1874812.1 IS66 family transposase [Phenylobacterium sp.]